jgi:hypothetical protein
MKSSTLKREIVVHPFLFAVYAVAGIYSRNANEIPVQWALRPVIILVALTTTLFFILNRKYRDAQYAGLVTTLSIFWFFFGHTHRVLQERSPFWNTTAGTAIALVMWTVPMMFMGSQWTWQRIQNKRMITTFLDVTAIVLVLFPLYLASGYVSETLFQKGIRESQADISVMTLQVPSAPPDIYLIVMDAYGRSDFLREEYGFDNSGFITYLKQAGFYVAEQSTPNYPQTVLSVSSLLNLDYLNESTKSFRGSGNRGPLTEYLQHSEARYALETIGYRFVALPTVTAFSQIRDADVYYNMTIGDVNEFEGVLLSSTVLNLLIEAWELDVPVPSYDLHRRYILYTLDTLKTVPQLSGPKFVFTHIVGPHPPFVLDAEGNPIRPDWPYNLRDSTFLGTSEEYMTGYVNEATYLNGRLEEVIEEILNTSENPPIIILQGDHGPGNYYNQFELDESCLRERYSILNAYYFPDQNYAALYPSISPVNSLRVVFNQYFGADLELFEDRNYYAGWLSPYDFIDVTDKSQLACHGIPD